MTRKESQRGGGEEGEDRKVSKGTEVLRNGTGERVRGRGRRV